MTVNEDILVAQGGGPTAVINQSLVGVIQEARRQHPGRAIYGARHGVRGIINEDLLDLGRLTDAELERIAATPAAALGSTRDKPDAAYCRTIFEVLRAHGIGRFFYIGGNDSADALRIVNEAAQAAAYPLCCVHIPKTIDNDLLENDHTPGFPSAAKFVAQAFAGANLDSAALPGVYIGVVMGRNAGYLTAASALGRQHTDDGPHLIYLPERAFVSERFLGDVKAVYDRLGRCVIAVSEGIQDAAGQPIVAQLAAKEVDAHGNLQLSGNGALADLLCDSIRSQIGIKRVRGDTFGYLQRSFLGCVSDVDQREARTVAVQAVRQAAREAQSGSMAIRRRAADGAARATATATAAAVAAAAATDDDPDYSVSYALVPLAAVARLTRHMPDAHIAASGTDVTPAFRRYLKPLLGSSFPQIAHLDAPRVPKRLQAS